MWVGPTVRAHIYRVPIQEVMIACKMILPPHHKCTPISVKHSKELRFNGVMKTWLMSPPSYTFVSQHQHTDGFQLPSGPLTITIQTSP